MRYAKNAGAVFSLKYHVVFCPKYRRPVLQSPVDDRLKKLFEGIARDYEWLLHALEIMPDHVHLFIEADSTWCVAEIVNRLKGISSRVLRQEFPFLRSCLPTLWSRSYFAATVGAVFETTIQHDIENQKGQ